MLPRRPSPVESLRTYLLCTAALVTALLASPPVWACGFVSARFQRPTEMPTAAHEQVLIVYDPRTSTEHFVRRVRFRRAKEPFGFVVPTPSVARVEEAENELFDELEKSCPHRLGEPILEYARGTGIEQGFGAGQARLGGSRAAPVRVITRKKLGDFTVFVVAATDAKAFERWLEDNGFGATKAGNDWLWNYVELGFHFVALRYDGQKDDEEEGLLSKTVRITFRTPVPFYPYKEPEDSQPQDDRKLMVWLTAGTPMVPVAAVTTAQGEHRLRRPWSETRPCETTASDVLKGHVAAEVERAIEAGAALQTFADVKTHRHGWGDVLLTPIEPRACDARCVKELLPLLPLLHPNLLAAEPANAKGLVLSKAPVRPARRGPADGPTSPESSAPVPAPSRAPAGGAGCSTASGRSSALPLLALGILALGLCRRRWWLVGAMTMLTTACDDERKSPAPASSPAATPVQAQPSGSAPERSTVPAPESPFTVPSRPREARAALIELLSGHRTGDLVETRSRPGDSGLGAVTFQLPEGFPLREEIATACAPDERVEALLRYEVDFFDGRARDAKVTGAASPSTLACVRERLLEATWPEPDVEKHTERGTLGIGDTGPHLRVHRRRVHAATRGNVRRTRAGRLHAPKVRMGATTVSGKLPTEVVQRIVRQNYGRFRLCYESGLGRNPDLEGRVTVHFTIGRDGSVQRAVNRGSDLPDAGAVKCVVESFRGVSFPSPEDGQPVTVVYPLVFSPG